MKRLAAVAAIVAVIGFAPEARAQELAQEPEPGKMEAGLYLGGFVSNYFHQFYDVDIMDREELNRISPQFGGRFAYFPLKFVGVEAEGGLTLATTKETEGSAKLFSARVQGVFQLPMRFTPFAVAGVALAHVSSDDGVLGSDTDFPVHLGAGARFYATRSIAIRADARLLRGPSSRSPYTLDASYGEFMLGVSFVPGRRKASEEEAPPVEADNDPDGDGVSGSMDDCPEEAGPAPGGCPVKDSDGDGINDPDDKCKDQPENKNGWMDDDGCVDTIPDSDGDGLDDKADQCKDEPEDKDNHKDDDGCVDSDNDGDALLDSSDRCPDESGPPDNRGCPDQDADSDGVVDRLDNCPDEPGTADNHGCKKKQLVVITRNQLQILDKVQFRTNKATLNPRSRPLLDNIARVLIAHPEIEKVKVEGHTDSEGSDERNMTLSQARAEAVVAYLVKKGIAADRLEAIGHGETVPLEDNATRKGRAANRRVEFNIVND